MSDRSIQNYKPAKTIEEQLNYLNENKRVQYNIINKQQAGEILLKYNYINVITPFKHKFAKTNRKGEVIKINGKHVYEHDVEFSQYYEEFTKEREKYPIIMYNISNFEMHFKAITAYHIVNAYDLSNSDKLKKFLESLQNRLELLKDKYPKRIKHMNETINNLIKDIFKYADIYCFFDRISLGSLLTVYTCLEKNMQNKILLDLEKFNMNFNIHKVPDFIKKVFCLVSIRNCIAHNNSLEILVRFYNTKNHLLRNNNNKKRFKKLIKELSVDRSKEKTH